MRDNTFTPGPWSLQPDKNHPNEVLHVVGGSTVVCGLDGIASPHRSNDRTFNEDKANMVLIAAAPDMYDALWEVIELSDRNQTQAGRTPECQRVYDIVRAALKKAEGE